jgi:biopolymer transport protein ExbB/TolQ
VATIAGLFAAIPASIFYNYFTNKVAILISRMDAFALELSNILQKNMLKQVARER